MLVFKDTFPYGEVSFLLGRNHMGFVDTLEKHMELEDRSVHDYIMKHNEFLKKIEYYDRFLDTGQTLGQVELAKMEYWYSKAQLYAHLIAGFYRGRQKLLEGQAEQEQANFFEQVRIKQYDERLSNSTDAQYLSRRAKGEKLVEAAGYEKGYMQWRGVAESYEQSINSLKDMVKGGRAEQRGLMYE